jgi:hypothetical protein
MKRSRSENVLTTGHATPPVDAALDGVLGPLADLLLDLSVGDELAAGAAEPVPPAAAPRPPPRRRRGRRATRDMT